jgi:hypothetical protein
MQSKNFWILGGACAGKSTAARALAAEVGAEVVDVDGRLYGSYFPQYNPKSTPALHTQFYHPNSLDWALSLSWDAYNAHTRQADQELLTLLFAELNTLPAALRIVDGGFSHPLVLSPPLPAAQIVCLTIPDALRVRIWEEAPDRQEMRDWISALPHPAEKWRTFLEFDKQIDRQLQDEAAQAGIPIIHRTEETPLPALMQQIRTAFSI